MRGWGERGSPSQGVGGVGVCVRALRRGVEVRVPGPLASRGQVSAAPRRRVCPAAPPAPRERPGGGRERGGRAGRDRAGQGRGAAGAGINFLCSSRLFLPLCSLRRPPPASGPAGPLPAAPRGLCLRGATAPLPPPAGAAGDPPGGPGGGEGCVAAAGGGRAGRTSYLARGGGRAGGEGGRGRCLALILSCLSR